MFTSTTISKHRKLFFFLSSMIIIFDVYFTYVYVLWNRRGHGKTNLCLQDYYYIIHLSSASIYIYISPGDRSTDKNTIKVNDRSCNVRLSVRHLSNGYLLMLY